jgi:hypothetical protein
MLGHVTSEQMMIRHSKSRKSRTLDFFSDGSQLLVSLAILVLT